MIHRQHTEYHDPEEGYYYFEDFLGNQLNEYEWYIEDPVSIVDPSIDGIVKMATTRRDTGMLCHYCGEWSVAKYVECTWKAKIETFDGGSWCRIGLLGTVEGSQHTSNWLTITYDNDYSNWRIQAYASGTGTSTTTSVATDNNYHVFRVKAFASNLVEYFLDGTSLGTITTNIPTVRLMPAIRYYNNKNRTRNVYADWVQLKGST